MTKLKLTDSEIDTIMEAFNSSELASQPLINHQSIELTLHNAKKVTIYFRGEEVGFDKDDLDEVTRQLSELKIG